MPRDFDEDKFVHCFLNQSRGGYDKEIDFYFKRLRDLGVNIETRQSRMLDSAGTADDESL